jgi:hypothetical protein
MPPLPSLGSPRCRVRCAYLFIPMVRTAYPTDVCRHPSRECSASPNARHPPLTSKSMNGLGPSPFLSASLQFSLRKRLPHFSFILFIVANGLKSGFERLPKEANPLEGFQEKPGHEPEQSRHNLYHPDLTRPNRSRASIVKIASLPLGHQSLEKQMINYL